MGRGETAVAASRAVGVTEQTYYRWRKEYGGLQVGQAKRMKDMELENRRLGVVRLTRTSLQQLLG